MPMGKLVAERATIRGDYRPGLIEAGKGLGF